MLSFRMSTYLRLLMVLMVYDAAFKPVGVPHSNYDGILNTTAAVPNGKFPRSLQLVSQLKVDFCQPLDKCPDTDESRERRTFCFPGPSQENQMYHCGLEETCETVVEFYYPRLPCGKGSYASPVLDGKSVYLQCKPCPEGRFNPEVRLSPENMDQCKAHWQVPPEKNTVLFSSGNSSHPAVYYCNASAGWASKHGTLFCKPSYQRCDCVYHENACPGEDLLPDRRCVPKCDGERPPGKNFSCVSRKDLNMNSSVQRPETTTITPTVSKPLDRDNKSVSQSSENEKGLSTGHILEIVFCTLGFASFLLLVIVIYKKKGSIIQIIRNINTTNVGRNSYTIKNNKKSNVTFSQINGESSDDEVKGQITLFVSDDYGTPICITASTSLKITRVVSKLDNGVIWYKDETRLTTCSNIFDMCIPATSYSDARYTFTNNTSQKKFYFHILSATSSDSGVYTCKHQINRKETTISVCDQQTSTGQTTRVWTTTVMTSASGSSSRLITNVSKSSTHASTMIWEPSAGTDVKTNTMAVSTLAAVAGATGAVIVTQAVVILFLIIRQKKCIQVKGDGAYEMPKPSGSIGNEERQYDVLYPSGDGNEMPHPSSVPPS